MMGGTASTRRIVVEDTGGEEYITISEAVARRLKQQPNADFRNKANDSSPPPTPTPVSQKKVIEPEGKVKTPDPQVFIPIPDPKVFIPDPKVTLQRKKEIDDFYNKKLQDLQERSAALQKITNEQFANAVKEVEQKFLNVTASPVCQDLQSKVLECYQTYPGEILNCSALVNAFSSCVDRARMTVSASRVQLMK